MAIHKYIHSDYVRNSTDDVVIVSEKNVETGKKRFNFIKNPERPVWITQPAKQVYADKREFEHERNLDRYSIKNVEMLNKLKELLHQGYGGYTSLKKLCDSPYVYGADVDVQCLVKMAYAKQHQDVVVDYTVGSLDIETSVLGGKEVILITFIDDKRNIYTAVYEPFLQGVSLDDATKVVHEKLNLFYQQLPKKLSDNIKANPFKLNFFGSNNELEIIDWIFKKIHESEIDFVTIWNMGYDIPYLLDRIKFRQGNELDIMAHPDIPKRYKRVEWRADTAKIAHITDRWDWFTTTGHVQFIDAMCLYSRIRKVKGRDISYKLDYISKLILGIGKLDIGNTNNHAILQETAFPAYIAYNIVDVILMILMEDVNEDVATLCSLIGNSKLSDFNKQTVQLKNMFYEYCRSKKCVPGTVGSKMMMWYDKLIPSSGGAVLSPLRARNTGVAILEESDIPTALHKGVLDIDVSSQYPSTAAAFNIAKQTKLSTCIDIEGFGIPHKKLNQAVLALANLDIKASGNVLMDIYKFIESNNDPKLDKILNKPVHVDKKLTSFKKIIDAYHKARVAGISGNKLHNETKTTADKLLMAKAVLGEPHVGDLFINISAPEENSVYLCNKFFGLPDYEEMKELLVG